MSKHALIASIATATGESQAAVGRVLESLGSETASRLRSGEEVTLPGIGKLKAIAKAARQGRNPSTGEAITIEAKTLPKFVAAKALKDRLN